MGVLMEIFPESMQGDDFLKPLRKLSTEQMFRVTRKLEWIQDNLNSAGTFCPSL